MNTVMRIGSISTFIVLSAAVGCDASEDTKTPPPASGSSDGASTYVLGSVMIDPDDNRTTYVQAIRALEGTFDNANAIELKGNGVLMTSRDAVFVGLAEEPTWVRYVADANGRLVESGRLSFLDYGIQYMDFANTIVDDTTAVSVLTGPKVAVIWNPQTMSITGEVNLSMLHKEGWELEAWTTTAYDGLVYIPGRWADWTAGKIRPGVSLTILDPKTKTIVATAEDERCTSGGRIVFDPAGYGYVMGDGRSYSSQMYANAAGQPAAPNCLLRIAPGQTVFEKDYFFTIPSLTGGPEAIGELDTAMNGSGIGFVKMFHPDQLPPGMQPVDFAFWQEKAHKTWRIELGNPPTAKPVEGIPFAALGFTPVAFEGRYYSGESSDGGKTSDIYETDPATNIATIKFKMDGYFYGVGRIALQK